MPLMQLAGDFAEVCKRWDRLHQSGELPRDDLVINDVMPETSLGRLRKLHREIEGKLEDAVAGVYRYRDAERRHAPRKRKRK